ncbi:uncharacterized protein LOC143277162 isoform X3 [Babylonia areolata]
MAQRALKDLVGQRQQERKGPASRYELPPRFQKLKENNAGVVNVGQDDNSDALDLQTEFPSEVKSWTAALVKEYPSGLWSSRLYVLYADKFGQPAPGNLIDVVQTWTDVARTELNQVANRYVIYPVTEQNKASETSNDFRNSAAPTEGNRKVSASSHRPPQWQDFTVSPPEMFSRGEEAKVFASTSVDLGRFFVQRADSCADSITDMLMDLGQTVAAPVPSSLTEGMFCAALYSQDHSWYRAQVQHRISDTEVAVIFVDYGNMESVSIDNMRCLTEDTATIPAQAIPCAMFGLKPLTGQTGWSEQAKTAFHKMLNGVPLLLEACGHREGCCLVSLWSEDSTDSLNEQLYKMGVVDAILPSEVPPDLELPQEGYLEVVVAFVDLKRCWLRIIGKEYSEALEAYEDRLGTLYKAAERQPRHLVEDSVCIVNSQHLYHRVRVTEILDDQANCFFVDHGYTDWFPLDKLVPLDNDINQSLPYQALCCVLVGLEVYMSNPITITELLERSKNKICVAEVIVRDPLKVMLYDTHGTDDININQEIAQKLGAEGHVIDIELFSPVSDNASESSPPSTPPPSSSPPVAADNASESSPPSTPPPSSSPPVATDNAAVSDVIDVDQLQSSTEALTVSDVTFAERDSAEVSVCVSSPEQSSGGSTKVSEDLRVDVSAGKGSPDGGAVSPYSDSLCVAYNTWPLPSYTPLPEVGVFFAVFVQSVVDPSNFVIVPHNMLARLEDLMMKMNERFNSAFSCEGAGEGGEVQTPTLVPSPQVNHLYMVVYNGFYYRAIYLATTDHVHHVLLPDYSFHVVVSQEEMFFLPKTFWPIPFAAFRASLHGIKPAGEGAERFWSEAVKYRFCEKTLSKTLMAVIRRVDSEEVEGVTGDADGALQTSRKLSLHLVDTSDPDTDVVIAEFLLATSPDVTAIV